MKKSLLILALAISIVSCDKKAEVKEVKTETLKRKRFIFLSLIWK